MAWKHTKKLFLDNYNAHMFALLISKLQEKCCIWPKIKTQKCSLYKSNGNSSVLFFNILCRLLFQCRGWGRGKRSDGIAPDRENISGLEPYAQFRWGYQHNIAYGSAIGVNEDENCGLFKKNWVQTHFAWFQIFRLINDLLLSNTS